jgi:(p)ppGpp synthase/HD superfamily hydrolase
VTLGEADVQRAQALSAKAHQGQVDKAGLPYIDHPRRVVGYLVNPTAQEVIVAWLHDVVEDTALSLEYVQKEFGSQVAAAVDAITRRPDETRSDYYARVKAKPNGTDREAADLGDNTDPERLQLLEPEVRADLEARYAHARHEIGIE